MRAAGALALVVPGLLACQPATTRPSFTPLPEAEVVEVRLSQEEATRRLAELMESDSIPAARVELRDGFIESLWFDPTTGEPSTRRPLGTGVVRVRAWSDPGRPGFAILTVETVYRPLADPSLPERELDREVPKDHPVAAKVRAGLQEMVKKYGGPPATDAERPAARPDGAGPEDEAPSDQE
jgi:hypothetical protein